MLVKTATSLVWKPVEVCSALCCTVGRQLPSFCAYIHWILGSLMTARQHPVGLMVERQMDPTACRFISI